MQEYAERCACLSAATGADKAGLSYLNAVNPTPHVTFAYDTYFPRRVSMTDGTGTTQYSYVPVGTLGALQLQQETPPLANSAIAYAHDALGRVSTRTVAGAGAEGFQYDALGRLVSDSNDLGTFTLAYLGQTDQITSRSLANSSLATTWTYLPNSGDRRLASITTTGLSSGQSTGFQFTSDAEGQITSSAQTSDATIAYPPTSGQQTASYNNLNQLTILQNPPPGSQPLTYDADGNLLSDGTHDFTWDADNRLVGITYPSQSGKATSFTYDGLGRRVAITSTPSGGGMAVTTDYTWCGGFPCQARDSSGTVVRGYYDEGEFLPGPPSRSLYYGPDQLGSVRRVFTASSVPSYDYDPYGNPLQTTTPLTDFGYASMVYSVDSGLDLTWNRVYDPAIGRWLSRDPLGENADPEGNLYNYVGGDPVNLIDPYGLWTAQIGISFNGQFGPINLNGEGGIALDSNGNVGGYLSAGVGKGTGEGAFVGAHASGSSANCIQDLGGYFGNEGGEFGDGVTGGGDWFAGPGSQNQPVTGGGFTLGVGGGGEFSSGGSNTRVYPWFSF